MKLFIKNFTLFALTLWLCIGNTFGARKKKNATNHSSHASSSQKTSNTGTDSKQENQQEALDCLLLAANIVQNQEQNNITQQNTQIAPTIQTRTHPLPRKTQEKNAFLRAALFNNDPEYIKNNIKSIDLKTLLFILETYEQQGGVQFYQDDIYQYIAQYVQASNEPTLILPTNNDQDTLIQNDQNNDCHLPSMQELLNALRLAEQGEINSSSNSESEYLKNYIDSMHKKIKYKCLQCNKKFSTEENLKRHINLGHKKIKYLCPQCNKELSTEGNLKRHINSTHKKIKYPCPQCNKSFSQKWSLKNHIKKKHENL